MSPTHFVPEERQIKIIHKYFLRPNTRTLFICFLLGSGDIHPNPKPNGPVNQHTPPYSNQQQRKSRKPKFPCTICSKRVIATSKSVVCKMCKSKTHFRCMDCDISSQSVLSSDFTNLSSISRLCCFYELPFSCDFIPKILSTSSHPSQLFHQDISSAEDPSTKDNPTTPGPQIPSSASDEHFQCFLKKGLHFIHLNMRSLLPKLSKLKLLAIKTRAAVICA